MASRVIVALLVLVAVAGCGKDENSPDMGAVPPKPNPDMMSKLPPEVRAQAQNAQQGSRAQADDMGSKLKNATGSHK